MLHIRNAIIVVDLVVVSVDVVPLVGLMLQLVFECILYAFTCISLMVTVVRVFKWILSNFRFFHLDQTIRLFVENVLLHKCHTMSNGAKMVSLVVCSKMLFLVYLILQMLSFQPRFGQFKWKRWIHKEHELTN